MSERGSARAGMAAVSKKFGRSLFRKQGHFTVLLIHRVDDCFSSYSDL